MPSLRPLALLLLLAPIAHAQLKCPILPAPPVTPADTAYAAGDLPLAESLYTSQPNAFAGLVRVQIERNEVPQALETAKKALAAAPPTAAAQALLGDALLRAGQVPEAAAAYLAALKLDPCNPRAHLGHARINALVGRHTVSAAELAAAHTLSPADPEITLFWLDSLPNPKRGSGLRALLDSQPILPPATLARVATGLTIIEQQALCLPTEPNTRASLDLAPLFYDGKSPRSFGLQVRFNNKFTSLLELDTSVDGIALNPTDAQKAGVRPLTTLPKDPTQSYTGVAERIRIGAVEYKDCPVRVYPANVFANSNSLIGTSFFRDRLIHVDYVAKVLALSPLPTPPAGNTQDPYVAPEEKNWSPAYISGPSVLIPTMIGKQGPYLFLLDSGSAENIFSPAALSTTLGKNRELTRGLKGYSGDIVKVLYDVQDPDPLHTIIKNPEGRILKAFTPSNTPVLRFTNNVRNDIYSIAFDISPLSHNAQLEIGGTLGFDLLTDFTYDINYRDSLVQILLDPNHRYSVLQGQKFY